MKGVLFSLVEDIVTAEHGPDTWDRILTTAGVEGGFTSLGNYPDEHFTALVSASASVLGVPAREVTLHLGEAALLVLSQRYPAFFTPHGRAVDFVLTLNDVIHPEVRKLHRESNPPHFDFDETASGDLVVTYRSTRRLCVLAEGMLHGAGAYYGEHLSVDHDQCVESGSATCVLRCRYTPAGLGERAPVPG